MSCGHTFIIIEDNDFNDLVDTPKIIGSAEFNNTIDGDYFVHLNAIHQKDLFTVNEIYKKVEEELNKSEKNDPAFNFFKEHFCEDLVWYLLGHDIKDKNKELFDILDSSPYKFEEPEEDYMYEDFDKGELRTILEDLFGMPLYDFDEVFLFDDYEACCRNITTPSGDVVYVYDICGERDN